MQFLWNRATFCIFLGVVLQSFCSIRLGWLNQLLGSISGEKFSLSYGTIFVHAWAVVTFFSRITGAYTLGKCAEARGFLATQKILILGYIITNFLFLLCFSYATVFYQIRSVILLIIYLNAFLLPATLILPAIHLMKIYNTSSHVKISMLIILASLLGYVLSCAVSTEFSPQVMSSIICGASFLCGFIYYVNRKCICSLEVSKVIEEKKYHQVLPDYRAKILALLVGGVCGAGMTHNYFFIEPYLLDVIIVNLTSPKINYVIYFHVELAAFLVLSSKICDHVNFLKLMFISLVGVLLVAFSLNMLGVSNTQEYIIYQVLFAFFFAGFLAPSFLLIFSLFQNNQPYFNGIFWYYLGISFSYLAGYFLSKELGHFHHYFLLKSPLVFIGIACLITMAIELPMIRLSSQQVRFCKVVFYKEKKVKE